MLKREPRFARRAVLTLYRGSPRGSHIMIGGCDDVRIGLSGKGEVNIQSYTGGRSAESLIQYN